MKAWEEVLTELGYETEQRGRLLVGTRRDDEETRRIFVGEGGEVRLERRRVEAEAATPATLAGVAGERVRRVEVFEAFFARDVRDLRSLLLAWEAG